MKWVDLMKPLVDTQPAYDAVATLGCELPKEAEAFLRLRMRESAKHLRETADYLNRKLSE